MSPAAQHKSKKTTSSSKKPLSHPPFAIMIADAIGSLKERSGSSQYAIAKFIEEKHKDLPSTFKKLLLLNLKKSVAAGKLVKVKNSFKLVPTTATTVKAAESKKPKTVAKPSAKAAESKAGENKKKKAVTKTKVKAVADGDGAKAKAKSVKSQVKKAAVKKSVKKSPVKKGAAKK